LILDRISIKSIIKKLLANIIAYLLYISMSVPIKKATFGNYFTTEVQKNVKAITQAAEGYGFTMKKFNNEKDLNIVLPKDAS